MNRDWWCSRDLAATPSLHFDHESSLSIVLHHTWTLNGKLLFLNCVSITTRCILPSCHFPASLEGGARQAMAHGWGVIGASSKEEMSCIWCLLSALTSWYGITYLEWFEYRSCEVRESRTTTEGLFWFGLHLLTTRPNVVCCTIVTSIIPLTFDRLVILYIHQTHWCNGIDFFFTHNTTYFLVSMCWRNELSHSTAPVALMHESRIPHFLYLLEENCSLPMTNSVLVPCCRPLLHVEITINLACNNQSITALYGEPGNL